MSTEKVGASQPNTRTTPGNNPSAGSQPPQTPHHGGGGPPDLRSSNDLDVDHPQSINHNHCPLDDCDLFTEHRYPAAVATHVERFFLVDHGQDLVNKFGPDVVNKVIAYMKDKLDREPDYVNNEINSLGGYFHSKCKKFAAGANTPTGPDRETALNRFKDRANSRKDYARARGPACGCPDFSHRPPCNHYRAR